MMTIMWRLVTIVIVSSWSVPGCQSMSDEERLQLRYEAEDMFYHAYHAYMDNAWPADELMPLSCRGRFRGREPSRGDIDDAMGNFSLTLIDSLDMLVVLGDLEEFEVAVKKIIDTVTFDTDVVVSVFETNIRVVGGLVSGHVLSELVQSKHGVMAWYRGELLNMAVDCANRLLPAFNSTTGLPYPRVNLRHGLRGLNNLQVTCTACAGTMILEFAALSRLTGEAVYEARASKAMDVLWASRHRQSNLVGNVLNVNTGDWIRKDSGVGAGIDSYYEYVAKAYVLLGEDKYLERWNSHYTAVMKYLGQGPLMMDVHMHRPTTNSKHFVDALGAFWPGLQVLMGDLKPAIEQHEVLYQIMKRHNFLPEAVTADFQVHWGQHLLRPEFVESTYFLYKATRDPYYLEAGKQVLQALQKHARVTCGYAAVKDVRTLQHEDRMDSFVITETFKYLYLLFTKEEESFLDISQFVFTTEAHLLPLSLARLSNNTVVPVMEDTFFEEEDEEVEYAQACPSTRYLFPRHSTVHDAAASLRKPLESLVEDTCPTKRLVKRKLTAGEFQSTSEEHQNMVQNMGITILKLPDGRVQLLHTFANAKSPEDGEEGLMFMQEMIELAKNPQQGTDSPPKQVGFIHQGKEIKLQAGPAQFGKDLKDHAVTAKVVMANHVRACGGSLQNGDSMWGKIVIVERGDCMFVEKARVLQSLGALGGIVMDNTDGTAAATSPLFAMSGDGVDDIKIPMVFLFTEEARQLMKVLAVNKDLSVTLEEKLGASDFLPKNIEAPVESDVADDSLEVASLSPAEKLKSAAHSLLKRANDPSKNFENFLDDEDNDDLVVARERMNKITTARTLSPKEDMDMEHDGDDDIESVSIDEDTDTGEVIATTTRVIKKADGTSQTIRTTERYVNGGTSREKTVGKVKLFKLDSDSDSETVSQNNDQSIDLENFKDIMAFLKPASEAAQKIVKELALDKPEVLSELVSVDFSELLVMFKYVFSTCDNIEDAYRKFFKSIQEHGAVKFYEQVSKQSNNGKSSTVNSKDNLEALQKLLSNYMEENEEILSMLGDHKLKLLAKEYLNQLNAAPSKLDTPDDSQKTENAP